MWLRRVGQEVSRSASACTGSLGLSRRWISSGSRLAALWGNGDYGRLGLGHLNSQWKPAICPAFDGSNDNSLRAIACGGAHTLFLTEKGCVYATGLNDFGQLGIPSVRSHVLEPLKVPGIPKEVIQISAGYRHSSAITVDGELYMWGNNSSGQLGLGRRAEKMVSSPHRLDCLDGFHIKMVALGSEHSIAITDEGHTLSWGAGGSGRLGHGHQSSIFEFLRSSSEYTPRLIKNFEGVKVTSIAAGLLHSACLSEEGYVFIFGEMSMSRPRFGEPKTATSPSILNKIPLSQGVACGGYHTCVVTGLQGGHHLPSEVSFWPENHSVQKEDCLGEYFPLPGLWKDGDRCTSDDKAIPVKHFFDEGELYTWGSNENGCLGLGGIDAFHSPQKVESSSLKFPVSEVSCGWKHTAAISGGCVFTWGWGGSHGTFSIDGHSSGGQLGHGDDVDYFEPNMVNLGKNLRALQISCGFNHTGAIFEFTDACG